MDVNTLLLDDRSLTSSASRTAIVPAAPAVDAASKEAERRRCVGA